jgi:hypothetical protein
MINVQEIKDKIKDFSSEKLCQIIVCDRYLKYNKELAVVAMQELSDRRDSGDSFDFESYIEKSLSELPSINNMSFDIRTVLANLAKVSK